MNNLDQRCDRRVESDFLEFLTLNLMGTVYKSLSELESVRDD